LVAEACHAVMFDQHIAFAGENVVVAADQLAKTE
jgi:hypothetical protein